MYMEAAKTHPDVEHQKIMQELKEEKELSDFIPYGAMILVQVSPPRLNNCRPSPGPRISNRPCPKRRKF